MDCRQGEQVLNLSRYREKKKVFVEACKGETRKKCINAPKVVPEVPVGSGTLAEGKAKRGDAHKVKELSRKYKIGSHTRGGP